MTASDPQSVRKARWYSPTVAKFLFTILATQVVLYHSQHFKWFAFNQLKGHTAVITVTTTVIGLLLVAGVVVLGRKAQFTLATLMLIVPVVVIPCSWLVQEMNQARLQAQIVAAFEPYRLNYNTPSPDSVIRKWFEPTFGKDLFVDVSEMLTDQAADANLVLLKEVKQLERLYLGRTNVTDAGLEHLKELTQLRFLLLDGTDVTDAGVADLQKALPNCSISHDP